MQVMKVLNAVKVLFAQGQEVNCLWYHDHRCLGVGKVKLPVYILHTEAFLAVYELTLDLTSQPLNR